MYPAFAAAVVNAYNIPELPIGGPSLIFSRTTIVNIYAGIIQFWNDSAIASDNPQVSQISLV